MSSKFRLAHGFLPSYIVELRYVTELLNLPPVIALS